MSYLQAALKVIAAKAKENQLPLLKQNSTVLQKSAERKPIDTREEIAKRDIKPFPADWLSRFDEGTLERLAIMTVDGGMTDQEALEATGKEPETIWSNPFPRGTPEAREASLTASREASRHGK